jgi:hemoglobin/transferrin/lactoferrin receptor protein
MRPIALSSRALPALVLLLTPSLPLAAQDTTAQTPDKPIRVSGITITATRTEKDVFLTPTPVAILNKLTLGEQAPNTVVDLFVQLPGLDVAGVGANQTRPTVRGQRGQRVLLLEDGIRLNNSRRQQDFGELPALVDVSMVDRVEVVRGPASVLYGTDAIGGVVNLITRTPTAEGVHGSLGYRYSSADVQSKLVGTVQGRRGRFGFLAGGAVREANAYSAPAGSYGDIDLAGETRVHDTGVGDNTIDLYASYDLSARHQVFGKYHRYRADRTGFGYVDPADYAPNLPFIQILYPYQDFDKYTAGYTGTRLGSALADRVSLVGYAQDNDRQLNNNVLIPLGGPGELEINTQNVTDLSTFGFRAEATKLVGGRVLLTYGADLFRDDSRNTDSSVSTVRGFGPPSADTSTTPLVPNATFRSWGVFAQGDITFTPRASAIAGVRYQHVSAATRATPGRTEPLVEETDQTVVAALNGLYRLTDDLTALAAIGRAFRSPGLVERFFNGPTPEGPGYQVPNPDLEPETSVNVDLGLRYRTPSVYLEGFVFRNEVRHGIRPSCRAEPDPSASPGACGDSVNGLPAYWNVNVDKLRYVGVEVTGDVRLPLHLGLGANYTHLSSKDVLDPSNPVGETYEDKLNAQLRYTHPSSRFAAEYAVRWTGERKDVLAASSPLGPTLPAFTTHSVRGWVTVVRRRTHTQRLGLAVTNLTDALYAEFQNASFFRPQPRRGVTLTWDMTF